MSVKQCDKCGTDLSAVKYVLISVHKCSTCGVVYVSEDYSPAHPIAMLQARIDYLEKEREAILETLTTLLYRTTDKDVRMDAMRYVTMNPFSKES